MPSKSIPVILQNIKTGRIVSAPSRAAAARSLGFGPYGKYQFDNVVKGKTLLLYGWGIPQTLNQEVFVKDASGKVYRETVESLARKVSVTCANRLRNGLPHQGLVPLTHDFSNVIPPKTHKVTGYLFRAAYDRKRPTRPLIRIDRLADAPEKLGISLHGAWALAHGKSTRVKGVTFVSFKHEDQMAFGESLGLDLVSSV